MEANLNTPLKSLFVFAGDVSADRHVSQLVSELKCRAPQLSIWGVGGPEMEAAGVELMRNLNEFTVLGIIEVLRFLPRLARLKKEVMASIATRKPDAVLLVDFAGFNLRLAAEIKSSYPELPIVYFISPQIWGSRPWRINTIARTVSKMLVIFPFEESYYESRGVKARFVGHPLTQNLPGPEKVEGRAAFCEKLGLDDKKPLIGVFPGSRRQEIRDLAPVVFKGVNWLKEEIPDVQFVISQANEAMAEELDSLLSGNKDYLAAKESIKLVPACDTYNIMANADIIWAKSGTTTLEVALFTKPMLIFYRADWLSYLIFLLFKQVKNVGWPNILAGRLIVPELIQLDCRAELFVRYSRDWLQVPGKRRQIIRQLSTLKTKLGAGNYAENAASELLASLGLKNRYQQSTP